MEKLTNTIRGWQQNILTQRFSFAAGHSRAPHPFWVMINKEVTDHVRSWRFIVLLLLILLTCFGSLYTSVSNLAKSIKPNDPTGTFFFLSSLHYPTVPCRPFTYSSASWGRYWV